MISKKVAMKAAEKSRFGKLVAYLLDPQGKKTRVGEVSITNCISTDTTWAETAEHLSKLTGTTTIIKEQVTRSGRGFLGTQVSTTMQEVQRPLLTPDECQRMPGPQKDEHDRITAAGDMVIYCAGHPAIYGRQPLYFEDKTFAA